MGFLNFFRKSKGTVKLSDSEWERLYKTNFEEFWEMVVKEGDLTKLPNHIVEMRSEKPLYGNDARNYFLDRLKRRASYSEFDRDITWKVLLKYKHELEEKNQSASMLDAIREYERHIIY